MSSKRGRKRNDNLPPNRARDVQRAFRARRAAHLEALEQRVAELEEENTTLRTALNLPPANRPPLGKGPTGKDKPKSSPNLPSSSSLPSIHSLPHMSPTMSLHSASRTESPSEASTRTHSLSPANMSVSLAQQQQQQQQQSSSSSHPIDSDGWNDVFLTKDQSNPPPSASSADYASATSYPPAPSSRPVVPDMYMHSVPQNYPHSADRPMSTDYSSSGYLMREDRRAYSYTPSSFSSHNQQSHNHSHTVPSMSSLAQQAGSMSSQSSLSYSHRRSITDPQGFRTIFNQTPHMRLPQHQHAPRLPSPPELTPDTSHPVYDMSDRRLDRMT